MIRIILFTGLFFGGIQSLFAQKKETGEVLKTFMDVCNNYKQLPLQVTVVFKKETNIPVYEDDTLSMDGSFIVESNHAYIKFGPVEQIVNDSFALVIMSNIKQMVLSENNQSVETLMSSMTGLPAKNASTDKMAIVYDAVLTKMNGQQYVIRITAKQNMYATALPKDEIILTYNPATNIPGKVETIRRSLVKKAAGLSLSKNIQAVSIPEKGDYVIKEDRTTCEFSKVTHEKNVPLPVSLKDRIEKDKTGEYVPVKAFEEYTLKLN